MKKDKYNIKFKDSNSLLDENNFANLFSVVDLGEKSYFNINKTINIVNLNDIPTSKYYIYELSEKDTWTGISFKFYNTYKLWWLICKFNNIQNPFNELSAGDCIKVLKPQYVKTILNNLMEY
jgi:hypothetical protein